MKESITVQEAVDLLNEALVRDPKAISSLFDGARVPCNASLAAHHSVLVDSGDTPGSLTVGPLGIINGMFGLDHNGLGAITMVCEDDGTISRFLPTKRPE